MLYMDKLSIAFNDVFRRLFNIKRGFSIASIYVEHNVISFKILLRKAAYNFRVCLTESGNHYVINAMVSSVFFTINLFI